jgi:hypothetical protein
MASYFIYGPDNQRPDFPKPLPFAVERKINRFPEINSLGLRREEFLPSVGFYTPGDRTLQLLPCLGVVVVQGVIAASLTSCSIRG